MFKYENSIRILERCFRRYLNLIVQLNTRIFMKQSRIISGTSTKNLFMEFIQNILFHWLRFPLLRYVYINKQIRNDFVAIQATKTRSATLRCPWFFWHGGAALPGLPEPADTWRPRCWPRCHLWRPRSPAGRATPRLRPWIWCKLGTDPWKASGR